MAQIKINPQLANLFKKVDSLKDKMVVSNKEPYVIKFDVLGLAQLKHEFNNYFKEVPQAIPKVIHQIWIGNDLPPWQQIDTFRKEFTSAFPDWKYILWQDEDIAKLDLVNKDLYTKENILSRKVNILKYEILLQFGGIYIDAYYRWLKYLPLHHLLTNTNQTGFFTGCKDISIFEKPVIGCSIQNPIMYHLIKLLYRTVKLHPTWISSEPYFYSDTIFSFDITILPPHFFYPIYKQNNKKEIELSKFYLN